MEFTSRILSSKRGQQRANPKPHCVTSPAHDPQQKADEADHWRVALPRLLIFPPVPPPQGRPRSWSCVRMKVADARGGKKTAWPPI
jgi:hypothetical protein